MKHKNLPKALKTLGFWQMWTMWTMWMDKSVFLCRIQKKQEKTKAFKKTGDEKISTFLIVRNDHKNVDNVDN